MDMYWYGNGLKHFHEGSVDWENDTIRVALFGAGFTPNQATDEFFDDLSNEVSGDGYTAGGAILGNAILTYDDENVRVVLDGDNVEWDPSSITAQYAVIYVEGSTPGEDDYVIAYGDEGEPRTSADAAFRIEWSGQGLLRTTAAADD